MPQPNGRQTPPSARGSARVAGGAPSKGDAVHDDELLDAVRAADGDVYDAADDEDDGDNGDDLGSDMLPTVGGRASELAAAALLGAALGAGLGWLAYQAGRPTPRYARAPRRRPAEVRNGSRAARRAMEIANVVAEATRESAHDLRGVIEETLRRELRGLARAARGRLR